MDDLHCTRALLAVKLGAKSCYRKLGKLNQIRNTWEADEDDQEMTSRVTEIELQCEYAMEEIRSIRKKTKEVLDQPPAYPGGPDLRSHGMVQIQCLCDRLHDAVDKLTSRIHELNDVANEAALMRIPEAYRRALHVQWEAQNMMSKADVLFNEDDWYDVSNADMDVDTPTANPAAGSEEDGEEHTAANDLEGFDDDGEYPDVDSSEGSESSDDETENEVDDDIF